MLSSVLRSERAVQVNVAIMRAFVSLLCNAIRSLMALPAKPRRTIGFRAGPPRGG